MWTISHFSWQTFRSSGAPNNVLAKVFERGHSQETIGKVYVGRDTYLMAFLIGKTLQICQSNSWLQYLLPVKKLQQIFFWKPSLELTYRYTHWEVWIQKVHFWDLSSYSFYKPQGSIFWPYMILALIHILPQK